jgi:hypothetical protein
LTGIVYDLGGPSIKSYPPILRRNGNTLRSGQWYDFDRHSTVTSAPSTLLPITIYHRPVASGSFFQISQSPNIIPAPTPQNRTRSRHYYDHLIPDLNVIPLQEVMSSLTRSNLLVSVKGCSTKERRGISQWLFSSGSFLYEGTSSPQENCTRYRAKLLGILSVLFIVYKGEQLYPAVSSYSILLECGHDKALKEAFRTSPEGVTTATQPNSDLIMDIRHLRHLISTSIQPTYSQPQLDFPLQPPPTDLRPPLLDIIHDTTTKHHGEAISYTPLFHVISDFHRNNALTEDLYSTINNLEYTIPLQEKLQKDNQWCEEVYQSVDWDAFYSAIRRVPRSHRISITKLSHQLWNTNLQKRKYYNQSDACPICQSATEDFNHVFRCTHTSANTFRQEAITNLFTTLRPSTPPLLLDTLKDCLQQWITSGRAHMPSLRSRLPALDIVHQAITNQTDIGWGAFCRGHVSKHWRKAFLTHYRPKTPQPESKRSEIVDRWLRLVLSSIWSFSEKNWQFRNKVVHSQLEEFKESKIVHNLRHRVQELYSQFQKDPFILPQSRSHLFNKPIQVISSMDRDGMTCWIKSIEEALLTREHRDRLEAVHLKSTLFRFFQLTRRSSNPKAAKRYVPSLWAAPFSSKHYQQTNHTRRSPER